MYQYTEFDRHFVRTRAAQYRSQFERYQSGQLPEEEFRPLRLQNGWYVQRFAPMLRVAVPYGELSSDQLRALAHIAREYDKPEEVLLAHAQNTQDAIDQRQPADGSKPRSQFPAPRLATGCGHFTTRQNVQFNWIALKHSADVMDLLANVNLHGIQTSGNCIRNITSDALAGIAPDEVADPRPFAEILRQWSTLHPEFAFLPRKFKVAISGGAEDRAAVGWHDVGLRVVKNSAGEIGFTVQAGGGMGRTPIIGTVLREFLPWPELLNYLEAVVRVYNRFGRRDNAYKARIKILIKAEGEHFIHEVEDEYAAIVAQDGAPHTITQAEFDRVAACFAVPEAVAQAPATGASTVVPSPAYTRWLQRNVHAHKTPGLRAVTLNFKRPGQAPGDASADQLDAAADLADCFSAGEARVTHEQNLLLPWVRESDLPALWQAAQQLGLARSTIGFLSDIIACPGGDFCALANARSLPIAQAILERYQDLDELHDIGSLDLHISGCSNSCGHHHSGHIGILGVDKDGMEWYQVTLGGSDGSAQSGAAGPGKVIGPSFLAAELPDVIEALLETYRQQRQPAHGAQNFGDQCPQHELLIDTVRRVGLDPFKAAADAVRHTPTLHKS